MVSPEFFEKIAIYWFLEGFGTLEMPGPNRQKKSDPKKIENILIFLYFLKICFRQKWSVFFWFSALGAPWCALKSLSRFQAKNILDPKKIEKQVENFIFRCGFTECVFVEKGMVFAFFSVSPLEPP